MSTNSSQQTGPSQGQEKNKDRKEAQRKGFTKIKQEEQIPETWKGSTHTHTDTHTKRERKTDKEVPETQIRIELKLELKLK